MNLLYYVCFNWFQSYHFKWVTCTNIYSKLCSKNSLLMLLLLIILLLLSLHSIEMEFDICYFDRINWKRNWITIIISINKWILSITFSSTVQLMSSIHQNLIHLHTNHHHPYLHHWLLHLFHHSFQFVQVIRF